MPTHVGTRTAVSKPHAAPRPGPAGSWEVGAPSPERGRRQRCPRAPRPEMTGTATARRLRGASGGLTRHDTEREADAVCPEKRPSGRGSVSDQLCSCGRPSGSRRPGVLVCRRVGTCLGIHAAFGTRAGALASGGHHAPLRRSPTNAVQPNAPEPRAPRVRWCPCPTSKDGRNQVVRGPGAAQAGRPWAPGPREEGRGHTAHLSCRVVLNAGDWPSRASSPGQVASYESGLHGAWQGWVPPSGTSQTALGHEVECSAKMARHGGAGVPKSPRLGGGCLLLCLTTSPGFCRLCHQRDTPSAVHSVRCHVMPLL